MGSFNTFKDKRYWILLMPFLITMVLYVYFTPKNVLEKPNVSTLSILIFPTLFWSTYHLGKYFGDKKKRDSIDESLGE
ncbi:hypothetical protein B857_02652 [Solibacillus isronensis B3W22]|uniref:Permease n=1 Tax=Solibacillus isronensis B3W22 TaxID=1224748 RepID=K1KKE3_9BACL|nr:hypothetical protein [Solibacillus isronensis]AMO85417.1 permease [Solibacillus silvestris]EKB44550.1 hypothetical protein B857_02652 [Solibacillus isronensis B3W22]